jgi:hypothetical protein
MRRLAILTVSLLIAATSASAASCRDPKTGKFIKCPATVAAPKQCKDPKTGRFAKCGTPGAVAA